VYNPQGAALPPPQANLEADYRRVLRERHGIMFNRLYALTNMPIQRFGAFLIANDAFDKYLDLLQSAHVAENVNQVMCRDLISVDWQGYVYDCDFNQMLGLPLQDALGRPIRLSELDPAVLEGRSIRVAGHCYGCTAGQ